MCGYQHRPGDDPAGGMTGTQAERENGGCAARAVGPPLDALTGGQAVGIAARCSSLSWMIWT